MPPPTSNMALFKVVNVSENEFIQSRETWNRLASSMEYPTIFCTWEWIHTWWNHFGREYERIILFVYRNDILTAVLPLFLDYGEKPSPITPRRLGYCGSTRLYPDHLDIICDKNHANACLDAAFEFLVKEFRGWDIFELPFVAEDSNIASWLEENHDRVRWRVKSQTFAPYINISGSFDDYLRSFNSRHRYTIVNRWRKFFDKHAALYDKCTDDNASACLETLFNLHARRAFTKQIDSSFSGEEIFRFHLDLLAAMRDQKRIWLRILKTENETIAAYYGFVFENRVFYYQLGLDPQWQSHSPGMVILYEVIREAFAGDFREFNFLQGEEEYKYKWTKTHRRLLTISVYNGNLAGSLSRLRDGAKENLKKLRITFVPQQQK